MTTRIWTGTITQRVIKQLRTAGYTVDKKDSGYVCSLETTEHPEGEQIFSAMKGSNGTYLVRYKDDLFYTADQKVEL
jgi:hypothetical protein